MTSSEVFSDREMVPPADNCPPARPNASDLRAADFPPTRRGFDPAAVRQFLDLVADEVLRLHEQIAAAHAETDRVKRNLRQWQTDHAATCRRSLRPASAGDPLPQTAPQHWAPRTRAAYDPDPPRHPERMADQPIMNWIASCGQ